eukprot:symbB.v1.2.008834.t1/scaffold556.1/size187764/5
MEERTVHVAVEKISGESLETQISSREIVKTLQIQIAKELNVPVLCQQLWIQDVDPEVHKRIGQKALEDAVNPIRVRDIQELKCLKYWPRGILSVLQMVYLLIMGKKPFGLREAFRDAQVVVGRGRHEYTGEHERLIVEECRKMLIDARGFVNALYGFPPGGEVPQQDIVQTVEDLIFEMGPDFNRDNLMKKSSLCVHLFDWINIALPICCNKGDSSTMQMDGRELLGSYVLGKEKAELQISLIVDYDKLFADLEKYQSPSRLESLESLKIIGPKCLERTLEALAKSLKAAAIEERTKALEVLQSE